MQLQIDVPGAEVAAGFEAAGVGAGLGASGLGAGGAAAATGAGVGSGAFVSGAGVEEGADEEGADPPAGATPSRSISMRLPPTATVSSSLANSCKITPASGALTVTSTFYFIKGLEKVLVCQTKVKDTLRLK
jgi:hypothetical protein